MNWLVIAEGSSDLLAKLSMCKDKNEIDCFHLK